jgi:hypothetical protein
MSTRLRRWLPHRAIAQRAAAALAWLERVDPGTHRRIKGLRLVTTYGLAAAMGSLPALIEHVPASASVASLAPAFALWASVSEARSTRAESSRDLSLLCMAAAAGALFFALWSSLCGASHHQCGRGFVELALVSGAFFAGYLKRFGVTGAGVGSQIYIGQLVAWSMGLTIAHTRAILLAMAISMVASIVPRLLSGPSERPVTLPALASEPVYARRAVSPALAMALQSSSGALVVVALNAWFGLPESAWAITACVYVVATSAVGTAERVRRRIVGTFIGVPLALACLPLAEHAPLLVWTMAAAAMVVYAMSLPERYDIACGAFAFALIVTMAASGVHSIPLLAARVWETLIGGALGLLAARFVFPLRLVR